MTFLAKTPILAAVVFVLSTTQFSFSADQFCPIPTDASLTQVKELQADCDAAVLAAKKAEVVVYPSLEDAIQASARPDRPAVRELTVKLKSGTKKFPIYAKSKSVFFRAAVIPQTVDEIISKVGWKSGALRPEVRYNDALPGTFSLDDRAMEYAGVLCQERFPKKSSIVGVIREDPIRPASIVWHTGFNDHERDPKVFIHLDEIEAGPGAEKPECRDIKMVATGEAFRKANMIPKFDTTDEWAVDKEIPPSCIVTTYRFQYSKVDNNYYTLDEAKVRCKEHLAKTNENPYQTFQQYLKTPKP